jgi:hypothetical protein
MMDIEEFKEELSILLNPEPDEDGMVPLEYPHPRHRRCLEGVRLWLLC